MPFSLWRIRPATEVAASATACRPDHELRHIGSGNPAEAWIPDSTGGNLSTDAQSANPKFLFRKFHGQSGGGEFGLNNRFGVIPHAYLDGLEHANMWQIPAVKLYEMITQSIGLLPSDRPPALGVTSLALGRQRGHLQPRLSRSWKTAFTVEARMTSLHSPRVASVAMAASILGKMGGARPRNCSNVDTSCSPRPI